MIRPRVFPVAEKHWERRFVLQSATTYCYKCKLPWINFHHSPFTICLIYSIFLLLTVVSNGWRYVLLHTGNTSSVMWNKNLSYFKWLNFANSLSLPSIYISIRLCKEIVTKMTQHFHVTIFSLLANLRSSVLRQLKIKLTSVYFN